MLATTTEPARTSSADTASRVVRKSRNVEQKVEAILRASETTYAISQYRGKCPLLLVLNETIFLPPSPSIFRGPSINR